MANKSDLANEAQFDENSLITFSKQYNSDFFYTSAKTGTNVNQSFQRLGEIMANYTIRLDGLSTPQDVLKEIISNYCILHGGANRAMPIINHQFKQAGVDITNPTKEGLLNIIERLTEVTKSFRGEDVAKEERSKYLRLVYKLQ